MPQADESVFQVTRALTLGVVVVVAIALERFRPHARLRPAWGTNLGLWAVDVVVTTSVCTACGWVVAGWAAERGVGLLHWLDLGGWLALGAGVLGLDAVSYLWHRANHQLPILWRFHRVHHADTSFHVTTGLRFHPGELLIALPVRLLAIILLGISPEGVLVFELVFGAANLLVHGNFDLPPRLDPLVQRILVTPAVHRSHHAADRHELDTNFGTIFSLWDRLAHSFRTGDGGRRVETGLPDRVHESALSLRGALLLPFGNRAH